MMWIIFNELNYQNEGDYLIKNFNFQKETRAFCFNYKSGKENLNLGSMANLIKHSNVLSGYVKISFINLQRNFTRFFFFSFL